MRTYPLGRAEQVLSDSTADLLDGILSPNTTILYGAAGIGKGRIVAGMIAAGLAGKPYAERSWSHPLERVAIVSTDAGGGSEYVRALRRYGVGIMYDENVRITIPEHVPSSQDWAEFCAATLAWHPSLIVVDSTTEAVRGSLNDDTVVRGLWTDLAPIHDPIAGVPLLLVHHVSKPTAESNGRPGRSPIGSGLWEAYSRSKVLVRSSGKEPGNVTLECRPRFAPEWRAYFEWDKPARDERVARLIYKTSRSAEELTAAKDAQEERKRATDGALNLKVADFVVANCQGLNQTQTIKAITKADIGAGSEKHVRATLTNHRKYGKLLEWDKSTNTWSRAPLPA